MFTKILFMNVSQFSIIIKNVWNQLNLRGFSKDKKLIFKLCQTKDSILNDNQVFIEVDSQKDIIDILKHFNLAFEITETDINNIIKENKLRHSDGICLILEIQ